MKMLSDMMKKEADKLIDSDYKLVHFYTGNEGYISIDPPQWANDFECPYCGNNSFYIFTLDKDRRAWLCGRNCAGSRMLSCAGAGQPPPQKKRVLLWPEFCEINGIGDEHYEVKFEKVKQSQGKVDYMLKFAIAPRGIILMRGDPGTGKTYAAMAICEYFTRTNDFCIFTTQKQMSNNWLLAHGDSMNNYVNSVMSTPLLIVDDFATGEPNPKFLEFFMELINTRLQWKSRGTVITTNLDVKKFNNFCGDALSDRIMTGQIFSFEGGTRRKKTIL